MDSELQGRAVMPVIAKRQSAPCIYCPFSRHYLPHLGRARTTNPSAICQ